MIFLRGVKTYYIFERYTSTADEDKTEEGVLPVSSGLENVRSIKTFDEKVDEEFKWKETKPQSYWYSFITLKIEDIVKVILMIFFIIIIY